MPRVSRGQLARTRAVVATWRSLGGIAVIQHMVVAMTLRLTDEEQHALRERAVLDGVSMQEAARRAVREFVRAAIIRNASALRPSW